jgi:hypothetical protein
MRKLKLVNKCHSKTSHNERLTRKTRQPSQKQERGGDDTHDESSYQTDRPSHSPKETLAGFVRKGCE